MTEQPKFLDGLPTESPWWLKNVEDALVDASDEGWVIEEPVVFHWTGEEEATWSIDPEDVT